MLLLKTFVVSQYVRGLETSGFRISDRAVDTVAPSHDRLVAIEKLPAVKLITHTRIITEGQSFHNLESQSAVGLQRTCFFIVFFFGSGYQRILHHVAFRITQYRVFTRQQLGVTSTDTDCRAVLQNLHYLVELRVHIATAFVRTVSGNTRAIHFQIIEVDTSCDGKALVHFALYTKRDIVFVASAIYHSSFVFEVAVRHIIIQFVIATIHAYAVVLRDGSTSHSAVEPVDTFTVAVILM